MKKLSLVLITIFFYMSSLAQKTVLSDNVSVDIPNGAEKLSRDAFSNFVNLKFNYSKLATTTLPRSDEHMSNKYFYRVGDVLVTLVRGRKRVPVKNDYLEELQKSMDYAHNLDKQTNNYSSSLKRVNDNNCLVIYDEAENVGYYHFYCSDSTNTLVLNGILQFSISDKNKATIILNNLLGSVRFTK